MRTSERRGNEDKLKKFIGYYVEYGAGGIYLLELFK